MKIDLEKITEEDLGEQTLLKGVTIDDKEYDLVITNRSNRLVLEFNNGDKVEYTMKIYDGKVRFERYVSRPKHDHDDNDNINVNIHININMPSEEGVKPIGTCHLTMMMMTPPTTDNVGGGGGGAPCLQIGCS